jgi:hypothetical protein
MPITITVIIPLLKKVYKLVGSRGPWSRLAYRRSTTVMDGCPAVSVNFVKQALAPSHLMTSKQQGMA